MNTEVKLTGETRFDSRREQWNWSRDSRLFIAEEAEANVAITERKRERFDAALAKLGSNPLAISG